MGDAVQVQVVWDQDPAAPVASYHGGPAPELWLNWHRWHVLPEMTRRIIVAHEMGHHEVGGFWFWADDPNQRVNIWRSEARARRAALLRLVPDELVLAAIGEGCQEMHEFAARWEIDEVSAAERLALYPGYGRGGRR